MSCQQDKPCTIHVYLEEEEPTIVEADPELEAPAHHGKLGVFLGLLLSLLCIAIPVLSVFLASIYENTYDEALSRTVILTLAQHPSAGQVPLYALPKVSVNQQLAVTATGTIHQRATQTTGLITFYNGAFTTQTVRAGTALTGKDGVTVVTEQAAVIPPATATTPPTYGTVSVTATSSMAGTAGDIPASDIDQACCGTSILAQNLYPFSGGQDARDITVLTNSDMSNGRQALTAQVDDAVNTQAQQEAKPGIILLPLSCTDMFSASHSADDQASASILTLTKTCTLLSYSAVDIEKLAQRSIAVPQGYHLVSFSALVVQSNVTAQGGTLTVHVIAYFKRDTIQISPYRFLVK